MSWISKNGGLPSFIKRVAKHIMEKGHSESQAYEMAVGVMPEMYVGGSKKA